GVSTSMLAGCVSRSDAQIADTRPSSSRAREFDVIVIGCGLAGACAAYEATRANAKVLVIDSGGAAANASHGTIFYMGGGTALQKTCNVHDSPEAMSKYLLASTG